MIKKRVGRNLGAIVEIMRVIDVYTDSDFNPVVDLVNSKAQRFEACDIVKFWGENVNLISSLEKDNEVLTITPPFSTPYVLGSIDINENYIDQITLLPSGEYPSSLISKDDVLIKRQDTRLILSDKIHQTSTRVQGSLEISNGAIPAQSATLAEPLLAYIAQLHATITALNASIDAVAISAGVPVPAPVASPPIPIISSELVKIER